MAMALALAPISAALAQSTASPLKYPETRKVDQVDDYHGTKVGDPYRWLEDLDSTETAEWVAAENKVTFAWLEQIPARERIRKRLTQLWDYERFGVPFKEGGRYFYSRNSGLQNQAVWYTTETLDGAPRELLDPNTLSRDGAVALSGLAVSDDAGWLAYGQSTAGSDWIEIKVRDIRTGQDREDHLKWIKFSGPAWSKDNKGFFYSRYDEPKAGGGKLQDVNYFQKLFYHRLGEPQDKDTLIYHRPDQKEWGFSGGVSDDGKYLIISVSQGTERKNRLYYQELGADGPKPWKQGQETVVKLLDDFDAEYDFIDNDGPVFWIRTDHAAPRGRLIAIDTRQPDRKNWKELIAQSADTLQSVSVVDNKFIASYLHDAHTLVKVFDLSGKPLRDVSLPGIGTAGGFGGKRRDKETFYSFASYNHPPTVFRYDVSTGESTVFRKPKVAINPDDFEVRQVFYKSKDGTRVPMFITARKGTKLDGNNPTVLYGYGGFNIPITPNFSTSTCVWLEMGGVYAVANLRGGGEYGKEWHDAGRLGKKQNVFDDFTAAAEWLIANKYTNSHKLAIYGGSNGGLLVGAAMTQRPDLFAAAVPAVGVMDMLRFHKFTIGWAWTSDYGCSDKPDQFKTLYAYSPLHNIRPGTSYPATLILTGDHDDRVVPSHSFKFAAALQAAQSGPNPVLIRIETRAGHGAGKPTTKIIEEQTDLWAFLVKVLGVTAAP